MHNLTIKTEAINLYQNGKSYAEISRLINVPPSTIQDWIKLNHIKVDEKCKIVEKNKKLEKENRLLKAIISSIPLSINDKNIIIDEISEKTEFNCYEVCDAIKQPRGTYHYHKFEEKSITQYEIRDDLLKEKITLIYNKSRGILGKRKILHILKRDYQINTTIDKVRDLMRELNLYTVIKKNKRIRNGVPKKKNFNEADLLKRDFRASKPNEKWVSDFTLIKSNHIKYHLLIIMDLFSRNVVGCFVSHTQNADILCKCFNRTFIKRGKPQELIFHSDNGVEYTSNKFKEILKKNNIKQSFSSKGTPLDNAVIESFNKTIKRELTNGESYKDIKDILSDIDWYIDFYNDYRPHSYNKYETPNEVEAKNNV